MMSPEFWEAIDWVCATIIIGAGMIAVWLIMFPQ